MLRLNIFKTTRKSLNWAEDGYSLEQHNISFILMLPNSKQKISQKIHFIKITHSAGDISYFHWECQQNNKRIKSEWHAIKNLIRPHDKIFRKKHSIYYYLLHWNLIAFDNSFKYRVIIWGNYCIKTNNRGDIHTNEGSSDAASLDYCCLFSCSTHTWITVCT